ncbi:hypothetical protein TNCV_2982471 [Trichonephila clavipes]|nr:hypothetical protein TNCV_2982471 [Trichonephila clavipes]
MAHPYDIQHVKPKTGWARLNPILIERIVSGTVSKWVVRKRHLSNQEWDGDGPCNFEPQSSDENETGAGPPSLNFHITPTAGRLSPDRFDVHQPLYTAGLQRH